MGVRHSADLVYMVEAKYTVRINQQKEAIMKKKEKTYLVVQLTETDGDIVVERMTGEEIRSLTKDSSEQIGMAIIEGNLIKGLDSVIDLRHL